MAIFHGNFLFLSYSYIPYITHAQNEHQIKAKSFMPLRELQLFEMSYEKY